MTDTTQTTDDGIDDVGSHTVDDAIVRQKLIDAEIPGAVIEFDPDEADRAGAFREDALSEEDARAAEEGIEPPALAPASAPAPAPAAIRTGGILARVRAQN